jgi:hypothetical protein
LALELLRKSRRVSEDKSRSSEAQKNTAAPKNSGTASNNSAEPSNATANKVEVRGANLSPEQRKKVTQVSQTIVSRNDAPRISNPDFSVSIGTVIPTHVHYVRVPETLGEVYPQWRDDDYFVVRTRSSLWTILAVSSRLYPLGRSGRAARRRRLST